MISKKQTILALAAGVASATALQAATVGTFKSELNTTPVSDTISSVIVTNVIPFAAGATSKSFQIQDSSGAIEAFSVPTTVYDPVVGDNINITGLSEAFRGLYETAAPAGGYTVVVNSHSNPLPSQTAFTTAEFQSGFDGTAFQSLIGNLSNVTFTAPGGTFAANGNTTVTSGGQTVTIFTPTNNPLVGQTIPSGAVNITGYFNEFDSGLAANTVPNNTGHELSPLSISAVPEPMGLGMFVIALGAMGRRRRA